MYYHQELVAQSVVSTVKNDYGGGMWKGCFPVKCEMTVLPQGVSCPMCGAVGMV